MSMAARRRAAPRLPREMVRNLRPAWRRREMSGDAIVGIMNSGLSWDEFRLVKSVAEARSLVGAAEILGVNHSTVFRRLAAVELAVGARLFERSRSGYEPTAAGEEMIALATAMAESVQEFERRVAGRDVKPTGELTVTVPGAVGLHLMPGIVAEFRALHPGRGGRVDPFQSDAGPVPSRRGRRDPPDQRPAGDVGWKANLHWAMGRLSPRRHGRRARLGADGIHGFHRVWRQHGAWIGETMDRGQCRSWAHCRYREFDPLHVGIGASGRWRGLVALFSRRSNARSDPGRLSSAGARCWFVDADPFRSSPRGAGASLHGIRRGGARETSPRDRGGRHWRDRMIVDWLASSMIGVTSSRTAPRSF